jgi:hypothetical protein
MAFPGKFNEKERESIDVGSAFVGRQSRKLNFPFVR